MFTLASSRLRKIDGPIIDAKAADRDWSNPHKRLTVNVDALMARL